MKKNYNLDINTFYTFEQYIPGLIILISFNKSALLEKFMSIKKI